MFAAGNPIISGNTLVGNTVDTKGGGISMVNDSDAVIVDNVISGNSGATGGGIAAEVPSGAVGPTIVNNTLVTNDGAGAVLKS
jgi:parallel beta-helix repeat protein